MYFQKQAGCETSRDKTAMKREKRRVSSKSKPFSAIYIYIYISKYKYQTATTKILTDEKGTRTPALRNIW